MLRGVKSYRYEGTFKGAVTGAADQGRVFTFAGLARQFERLAGPAGPALPEIPGVKPASRRVK